MPPTTCSTTTAYPLAQLSSTFQSTWPASPPVPPTTSRLRTAPWNTALPVPPPARTAQMPPSASAASVAFTTSTSPAQLHAVRGTMPITPPIHAKTAFLPAEHAPVRLPVFLVRLASGMDRNVPHPVLQVNLLILPTMYVRIAMPLVLLASTQPRHVPVATLPWYSTILSVWVAALPGFTPIMAPVQNAFLLATHALMHLLVWPVLSTTFWTEAANLHAPQPTTKMTQLWHAWPANLSVRPALPPIHVPRAWVAASSQDNVLHPAPPPASSPLPIPLRAHALANSAYTLAAHVPTLQPASAVWMASSQMEPAQPPVPPTILEILHQDFANSAAIASQTAWRAPLRAVLYATLPIISSMELAWPVALLSTTFLLNNVPSAQPPAWPAQTHPPASHA